MVEVKSSFDSSVTKSLSRFTMKRFWWLYLIFSLIFVLIGIGSITMPEESSDIGFGLFMLLFGVSFFPLCLGLTVLIQKSMDKSMPLLSGNTMNYFRFDEYGFYQEQTNGEDFKATAFSRYFLLHSAIETSTHFFIYISRVQAHVVPKKDLISGTVEELRYYLSTQMGAKFKNKS